MDNIIMKFPTMKDEINNISICPYHEIAYQTKMNGTVSYDKEYFEKYIKYKNTDISKKINGERVNLVKKYLKNPNILDFGIGSGEFIESFNFKSYGFDINIYGIAWLKERNLFLNPYKESLKNINGVTFWDSLEHLQNPGNILRLIPKHTKIFISIPIFDNIYKIFESKHFRPNEHFYYFTAFGLKFYLWYYGYTFLESLDFEIKAGRENIYTFVFIKDDKCCYN